MSTKMNSFVKQFVAAIKGDDAEVQGQKAWRSAESALKVQIASLDGDTIKLEDDVENAKEELAHARINNGNIISNRDWYVRDLVAAKNELTLAEKALKDHNIKLDFLKSEYDSLKAE